MIRIKVLKLKDVLFAAAMVILAVLIIVLLVQAFSGARASAPTEAQVTWSEDLPQAGSSPQGAVSRGDANRPEEGDKPFSLSDYLLPRALSDPSALLSWKLPLATPNATAVPATASETTHEGDARDDPAVGPEIQIKLKQTQDDFQPLPADGNGPQVLIYQTHSFEAYQQVAEDPYQETDKWRTKDNEHNVAAVGEAIKQRLENTYGIPVLHDVTNHETPKLGTAYTRSVVTAQKLVQENPNLKLVIDLHRDAEVKGQANTVTAPDGTEVAKILLVIGTGEEGFTEKPDWEKNYKIALRLTNELNKLVPGICKPVDVRTGRYNQHVSDKSVLIEVGNNANTLSEAKAAAGYLADAIAKVVPPADDGGTGDSGAGEGLSLVPQG